MVLLIKCNLTLNIKLVIFWVSCMSFLTPPYGMINYYLWVVDQMLLRILLFQLSSVDAHMRITLLFARRFFKTGVAWVSKTQLKAVRGNTKYEFITIFKSYCLNWSWDVLNGIG